MTVDSLIFLLIVATLTALAARRLRVPYTVGLVAAGAALALAHVQTGRGLTGHLLFNALLPPLLFEAALSLSWAELRRDAAADPDAGDGGGHHLGLVVAAGMALLLHWPWPAATVFGVLIAATDPVSVLATFKETGVVGRLRLLVEAESLLNDGVAAVLFSLAVAAAQAGPGRRAGIRAHWPGRWLWTLGGIAVGALCGGVAVLLAGRSTADHLIETALTTVAAYGSFLLADHVHVSGRAGDTDGGPGDGQRRRTAPGNSPFFTERGREVALAFWEFAAFVANSLIFLLIGLGNAQAPFHALSLLAIFTAIALVWLGRAATVYPLCALFARSRARIPPRHQHVLFWGGLRGALALALSLSLPPGMAYRTEIILATFSVVAFSIIVQGIAMPLLLKRGACCRRNPSGSLEARYLAVPLEDGKGAQLLADRYPLPQGEVASLGEPEGFLNACRHPEREASSLETLPSPRPSADPCRGGCRGRCRSGRRQGHRCRWSIAGRRQSCRPCCRHRPDVGGRVGWGGHGSLLRA